MADWFAWRGRGYPRRWSRYCRVARRSPCAFYKLRWTRISSGPGRRDTRNRPADARRSWRTRDIRFLGCYNCCWNCKADWTPCRPRSSYTNPSRWNKWMSDGCCRDCCSCVSPGCTSSRFDRGCSPRSEDPAWTAKGNCLTWLERRIFLDLSSNFLNFPRIWVYSVSLAIDKLSLPRQWASYRGEACRGRRELDFPARVLVDWVSVAVHYLCHYPWKLLMANHGHLPQGPDVPRRIRIHL